jgi:hypothetical protein
VPDLSTQQSNGLDHPDQGRLIFNVIVVDADEIFGLGGV